MTTAVAVVLICAGALTFLFALSDAHTLRIIVGLLALVAGILAFWWVPALTGVS